MSVRDLLVQDYNCKKMDNNKEWKRWGTSAESKKFLDNKVMVHGKI